MWLDLGLLNISCVVTAATADNRIFSGFGQHLELMGETSADRARIRLHRTKLKATASEDSLISVKHILIFPTAILHVRVEAVGIFHDELSAAHQAKARAHFVAELGLDLVEVQRKLAVRSDHSAHQVRDDLFVCRPKAKITFVTIFKTEEIFAVELPAAAFLPQLGRRSDRKQKLLCAGAIQLLAHNSFDLANDSQRQGKVVVNSPAYLTDHAGAN